jgi:hypothetical protein
MAGLTGRVIMQVPKHLAGQVLKRQPDDRLGCITLEMG